MKIVTIEYRDPRGNSLVSQERLVLDGTEQVILKTDKMLTGSAMNVIRRRISDFLQGKSSVLILENGIEITFVKRSFVMTDEEEMQYHVEEIGWDTIDEFTQNCLERILCASIP